MGGQVKLRVTPERFCQEVAEETTTRDYGDIPLRKAFKKRNKDLFIPVSRHKSLPCPAFFGFPTISEAWRERRDGGRATWTGCVRGLERERGGGDKRRRLCTDRRETGSDSRVERLLTMGQEERDESKKKDLPRRTWFLAWLLMLRTSHMEALYQPLIFLIAIG